MDTKQSHIRVEILLRPNVDGSNLYYLGYVNIGSLIKPVIAILSITCRSLGDIWLDRFLSWDPLPPLPPPQVSRMNGFLSKVNPHVCEHLPHRRQAPIIISRSNNRDVICSALSPIHTKHGYGEQ